MLLTVRSGLVMAWRFATWPTSRSPVLVKPTTLGVVRAPSALAMTTGSPPSITATQLFVVPRSMPMILLIVYLSLFITQIWWNSHLWERAKGPFGELFGHDHRGVPDDPVAQLVAFLEHLQHGAALLAVLGGLLHHRVV